MKLVAALIFTISTSAVFASFSIVNFDKIKEKEKGKAKVEKYSLKNIHRPASFFSLSSITDNNYKVYTPSPLLFPNKMQLVDPTQEDNNNTSENDMYIQSTLRINSGKSIVVYPFNFKVKATPLGLFKTPTAPNR